MVKERQAAVCALGYVGLVSTMPTEWGHFGVEVLGFARVERADGGVERFKMDQRTWRISVDAGDHDGLAFLGFEVAGPQAFASLLAKLSAGGLNVSVGTAELASQRQVAAVASFTDPDGNRLEVFWGPKEDPHQFVSQTGTRFLTGAWGVGHVLLRAEDAQKSAAFYEETLGFSLTDYIAIGPDKSARFLRCNARHHSIALVDALPGVGLEHLMVQVETLDDLGMAHDRALRAGTEITNSIGRHANDLMVSFYIRAPGGIQVEYGWGGRTIGDDWIATEFQGSGDLWGHHGPMMDQIASLQSQPK